MRVRSGRSPARVGFIAIACAGGLSAALLARDALTAPPVPRPAAGVHTRPRAKSASPPASASVVVPAPPPPNAQSGTNSRGDRIQDVIGGEKIQDVGKIPDRAAIIISLEVPGGKPLPPGATQITVGGTPVVSTSTGSLPVVGNHPGAPHPAILQGVPQFAALGQRPVFGAVDSFADVVAVGSANVYGCTGVLVAARWVLTARHCLPATKVLFGNNVTAAFGTVAVASSRVPPDPRLDAALLLLDRPVVISPRRFRAANESAPPLGQLRLMGFGSNDLTGHLGLGVKRFVDVPVFGWGCDPARADHTGCEIETEMVIPRHGISDTCDGDSGGPVFEYVDGGYRLVGLTSRPLPDSASRCGQGGIYTRLDRLAGWLAVTLSSSPGAP